nr:nucleotidyltransferase domain-containing protein [Bacillus alkalicola]
MREQIINELKAIVSETLSDQSVKVYLFGSWARAEEKQSSDIDLAIEATDPLPQIKWVELIDRIEESTIPYQVDIVDLDTASPALVNNIKEEGILWEDCRRG